MIDIDTQILGDIGLTNAQIKVYIALLELGETTSGPIIKKSELQNSVVYNALNQLMELGLVTFVIKGKRKYFSTTDPNNLIGFIEDKKEKIKELVPKLLAKQKFAKIKQESRVFIGWKGLKTALNMTLEALPEGSDYIGFPAGFEEQYSEEATKFFREFQKKRALKKYKIKFITNEVSRKKVESYQYYEKFGKPKYRFVHGIAPIGIIIFGENVLNIAFEEQPIAIIMTSKQIARNYRDFFYALWETATI